MQHAESGYARRKHPEEGRHTPTRKLEFIGHDGNRLAGQLDVPMGPPRAYALFANCFTCSKDVLASVHISAVLARAGIAVLRFDFTGLGMSEGEFANTNFSTNVADRVCAADLLRSEYQAPALLVGHSLGGAAVLAAAGRIPEVKTVAALAAPSEPAQIEQLLGATATRRRKLSCSGAVSPPSVSSSKTSKNQTV